MTRSLLVVDDDDDLRHQLVRALARRGFAVRAAATAEEAIELAADEAPSYAVVDLRLGRDNGLEVVRDLLRIEPTTRVLVLTGYGSIATATGAIRLGAVDYLTKPANADDVVAALAAETGGLSVPAPRPPTLAEAEWEHIQRVLADCNGNITHAAEALGIHRRSLQRKLRRRPDDDEAGGAAD